MRQERERKKKFLEYPKLSVETTIVGWDWVKAHSDEHPTGHKFSLLIFFFSQLKIKNKFLGDIL